MPLEALSQLESKIDALIESRSSLRRENEELRSALDDRDKRLQQLEQEKSTVDGTVDSLRSDAQERQNRLDEAGGRVQALIAKLESVA